MPVAMPARLEAILPDNRKELISWYVQLREVRRSPGGELCRIRCPSKEADRCCEKGTIVEQETELGMWTHCNVQFAP